MSKNHFLPFQINTTIFILVNFFIQNGCRRPFWMSETHFRWHFWPFYIDMQLNFFFEIFDKMTAVGHFGCPKFTFDHISGHFRLIRIFYFFLNYKVAAGGHFVRPKITFHHISGHFRSIRNLFFSICLQNCQCFWPL